MVEKLSVIFYNIEFTFYGSFLLVFKANNRKKFYYEKKMKMLLKMRIYLKISNGFLFFYV